MSRRLRGVTAPKAPREPRRSLSTVRRARRSQGPCHPETRRRGRRRGSSAGGLRHRIVSTFALETRHSRSRSADRSWPWAPQRHPATGAVGRRASDRGRVGRVCRRRLDPGARRACGHRDRDRQRRVDGRLLRPRRRPESASAKTSPSARGVYVSDVAHEYDDPSRPILEQGTSNT